jgi:hypothetical protein
MRYIRDALGETVTAEGVAMWVGARLWPAEHGDVALEGMVHVSCRSGIVWLKYRGGDENGARRMQSTLLILRVVGGGPLLMKEAYLGGIGLLVLDISIRQLGEGSS